MATNSDSPSPVNVIAPISRASLRNRACLYAIMFEMVGAKARANQNVVMCSIISLLLGLVSISQCLQYSNAQNETTAVSIGSKLSLSTTIHNNYHYPINYFAIYEILDSSGYTDSLIQTQSQLPGSGNSTSLAEWIPIKPGVYQVETLVLSALDVPELLLPIWNSSVSVSENQFNQGIPQVITQAGSIGNVASQVAESPPNPTPLPTLQQLKEYALKKINQDRATFGLPSVRLSGNPSAQRHADEMVVTRLLSHWTPDGMKPYMRYTIMGGEGSVAQNIAGGAYDNATIAQCQAGIYQCAPTANDLYQSIDDSEYGMMYNDSTCCENGHRDNILDPYHTDVSLGIAYDNYSFFIVENFENNYIIYDKPITTDNRTISISGKVTSGIISQILINYDPLPTHQTYLQNVDRISYDPGVFVGGVVPDLSQYDNGTTIRAARWDASMSNSINVSFDLSSVMTKPGVYTIYTYFQDHAGNEFEVTIYSVFHN